MTRREREIAREYIIIGAILGCITGAVMIYGIMI